MKLVITGAAGQLGQELARQLASGGSGLGTLPECLQGVQPVLLDMPDGDLSCLESTRSLLHKHTPDAVINCAAFTNVDRCETEPDTAFAANAIAPRNLAIVCEELGAKLVHVSTDYVFSGRGDTPFSETDATGAASVYGKTKSLGEDYVKAFCSRWFVARTAWLYGSDGGNFVKTILKAAKEKGSLKVVDDQLGNPTNAEDLAHHLLLLAAGEEYGTYHITGGGICSWFDFAKEIVRLGGIQAQVNPCTTEEFPRPAPRPAYSALDHAMLRCTIGDGMRPWQQALEAFFAKNPLEKLLG